jgi:hypothetical protein
MKTTTLTSIPYASLHQVTGGQAAKVDEVIEQGETGLRVGTLLGAGAMRDGICKDGGEAACTLAKRLYDDVREVVRRN